eukprot:4457461-Amphidinium_carterae.1
MKSWDDCRVRQREVLQKIGFEYQKKSGMTLNLLSKLVENFSDSCSSDLICFVLVEGLTGRVDDKPIGGFASLMEAMSPEPQMSHEVAQRRHQDEPAEVHQPPLHDAAPI